MRPAFTPGFVRQYQGLPQHLQRRFDRVLVLLLADLRHPSLRAKKMAGQHDPEGRDIWEARVTQGYRFTFAIDGDTYILYRIGPPDVERRPS
jgi:mRNA-degrading endonuclease RelE of RelBE toxin-antitoxin system